MTPTQRFSILLTLITVGFACLGWLIRQLISQGSALNNERLESLKRHDDSNAKALAVFAADVGHSVKRLTELYEDMSQRQARTEGILSELNKKAS